MLAERQGKTTTGQRRGARTRLWAGSGLLSALTLLKTLTWPTAIPTYTLQSNLLGTFTLDFSAWDLLQDYFVKIGLQEQKVDLSKYVDNSYIQRAADQLGPD